MRVAEVIEVKLNKHPDADKLSICNIGGYQCVTATEGWTEGMLGVFIEPDTLVPATRKEFDFLLKDAKDYDGQQRTRVRAKKLRGVVSYGLLIQAPPGLKVGDNAWDLLELSHYDPEVLRQGKGEDKLYLGGEVEKAPDLPFSLFKYDLENLQSSKMQGVFKDGEEVVVTEKLDGSNMCCVYWEGKYHVKSRGEWKREYPNYDHITTSNIYAQILKAAVKKDKDNLPTFEELQQRAQEIVDKVQSKPKQQNGFWSAFRNSEDWLGKFCRDHEGVVVWGEMIGSGRIPYAMKASFRVFDILREGRFVDTFEAREVLGEELQWVPFLGKLPFSLPSIGVLAVGKSLLNSNVIREGCVVKPLQERWHWKVGRTVGKYVSHEYLSKY